MRQKPGTERSRQRSLPPSRRGGKRDQGIPAAASTADWLKYVVLKLIGLGITAAAVSQGSSFWYDMLKRLTGPAAALGPEPRTPQKEGALG